MEDRETARMRKYEESKTTRIMMATAPHVTSGLGLRKFQTDCFFFVDTNVRVTGVYVNIGCARYNGQSSGECSAGHLEQEYLIQYNSFRHRYEVTR